MRNENVKEKRNKKDSSVSTTGSNIVVGLKKRALHMIEGLKRKTVLDVAKIIISITAILHLVLSRTHIRALLQLETEICGLWMFMFILLGLVALFNAIRNKEGKISTTIFSIIVLALTCLCGIMLMTFYFKGINEQEKINTAIVNQAVVLAIVMIALYAIGTVFTVIGMFKNYSKNKKSKEIIHNV